MKNIQKEQDAYIHNSIVMSIDCGVPFNFDSIIAKAALSYATEDDSLSEYFKAAFKDKYHFSPQRDFLLRSGYIKKVIEPINQYILTDKGQSVQEAGGFLNYYKKQKIKDRLTNIKTIGTYILTPLIAIITTIGLIYPLFKKDNPMEIKQPIILHIDNLKEIPLIDSTYNNKDTTITSRGKVNHM